MSNLSMVQEININNIGRENDIKEELRMSVISMAMNIGTFKVNLTVNKSNKLVDKKKRKDLNTSRIRDAIRAKDEKINEHYICNFMK